MTMRILVATLALALGAVAFAPAQEPRTTLPDALEVESTVTTVPYPRVEGHVKNHSLYNLQNVRLHVAVLDDGGKTVGEADGWVFGNVFSGGQTYFVVAIPRTGASYRVTVTSYDIAARGH
jgi:hypothetical protein